jgi:ABC-2 type transport system permease protein
MRRVLAIAETELLALVRTKFFVIGIISMPVLGAVLATFLRVADRQIDRDDRPFAVVDRTGVLYDAVAREADAFNRESGHGASQTGPHFYPVRIDPGTRLEEDLRVDLSMRVRAGELFAFVEIPAGAVETNAPATIRYYSRSTSYVRLANWLRDVLSDEVERRRFARVGIDPELVARLTARTDLATFGLVERRPDGSTGPAVRVDAVQRLAVPLFFLVLMFMAVMSSAQHLIHTIIEEKMSKISEVLLGSVSAFQLLMGKLLGIVALSFLLAFVYLTIGIYAVLNFGRPDLINVPLLGWFLVLLVCANLLYGALFQALSSACSDLKDAQSLLQPAMMVLIAAYLASFLVVRAPEAPLAVALSFFPLFTPFAMLLRLAMSPPPPAWQVLVSVVTLIVTTIGVVWAAGRIFRVGLLMQGKPPNLPELIRWIRQ